MLHGVSHVLGAVGPDVQFRNPAVGGQERGPRDLKQLDAEVPMLQKSDTGGQLIEILVRNKPETPRAKDCLDKGFFGSEYIFLRFCMDLS